MFFRNTPMVAVAALMMVGATGAAAQSGSPLVVHGFLTQGYADATDYPQFGIPTDGTADYASAAIQFRYALSDNDALVLQFAHVRLGSSAIGELYDDVALDWGFYQHRFGSTSIRVGKVPMPRGLFNEVRDVGTLLPFFRASKAFYSEGVEAVDGAAISHRLGLPHGFALEGTAYFGEFDVRAEVAQADGVGVSDERATGALGGQLWLYTPIPGLRATVSRVHSSFEGAENPAKDEFTLWTASVDGSFDRFFARAEYALAEAENDLVYTAYYGQAGVRMYRGLWLNGQSEYNGMRLVGLAELIGFEHEFDAIRDHAVGLSYRINSRVVLKGEYHVFDGYQVGVPVDVFGDPVDNRYFIVSVSAAF